MLYPQNGVRVVAIDFVTPLYADLAVVRTRVVGAGRPRTNVGDSLRRVRANSAHSIEYITQ